MLIEIKNRFTNAVIFSGEYDSIKLGVEDAVKQRVDLAGANLAGADLGCANFAGAYLAGANLAGAYLGDANFAGAYLAGGKPKADGYVKKFTEEDLDACWPAYKTYLLEILNGEYTVIAAVEDLSSLVGSRFDPRSKAEWEKVDE